MSHEFSHLSDTGIFLVVKEQLLQTMFYQAVKSE